MCLGLPMRVEEVHGTFALCSAEGRVERVDLALVPDAARGDHVLVFQGAARRLLDADEARLIAEALSGVAAIMAGDVDESRIARAFADLVDREPTLPPHLAAAYAAGRKEA
ncbi:HypC/HybG/HupF family hydrogenase formation chaperone [Xanthobacter autotrophicus DSM 431]|uniref:HypC/HybG/HupF family hydrogenase formation chaperone n=1 Tax=Xanthobacter nonsaccharivorans TaxID=3119912 RepID=UPI0037276D4C